MLKVDVVRTNEAQWPRRPQINDKELSKRALPEGLHPCFRPRRRTTMPPTNRKFLGELKRSQKLVVAHPDWTEHHMRAS